MNTNDAARATAEAVPEPSILSLYQTWSAEYDRINREGSGFTSEQVAALCEPHAAMKDQICSLDSRTPLDVLAKVIAASYKLESCVDSGWIDSIRDEALAMLKPQECSGTPVSDMYRQWMAIAGQGFEELTDAERDARCTTYLELKNRIIAAPPLCVRDVAIQFITDTDHSASDFSDAFFDKMMALVVEVAA